LDGEIGTIQWQTIEFKFHPFRGINLTQLDKKNGFSREKVTARGHDDVAMPKGKAAKSGTGRAGAC